MLAHLPFPTIAAINGLCFSGGLELSLGLLNHVFEKGDFLQQVETYMESLVVNGPRALKSVKHIVDTAIPLSEKKALAIESEQAVDTILSGQCIEGISAFLEKREPDRQK